MTKAQPLPAKADKPKAASLRTFVSAFNIESKIIIPITIIVSLSNPIRCLVQYEHEKYIYNVMKSVKGIIISSLH